MSSWRGDRFPGSCRRVGLNLLIIFLGMGTSLVLGAGMGLVLGEGMGFTIDTGITNLTLGEGIGFVLGPILRIGFGVGTGFALHAYSVRLPW